MIDEAYTTDLHLQVIHQWVWSGLYDREALDERVDEYLQSGDARILNPHMVAAVVQREFARKAKEEASWDTHTDCDRLDAAFNHLEALGIVGLHAASETYWDVYNDASVHALVLEEFENRDFTGFCYYRWTDVSAALLNLGLQISFGHFADTADEFDAFASETGEVGKVVKKTLQAHGLKVTWDEDAMNRLEIKDFVWRRRSPSESGLQ